MMSFAVNANQMDNAIETNITSAIEIEQDKLAFAPLRKPDTDIMTVAAR